MSDPTDPAEWQKRQEAYLTNAFSRAKKAPADKPLDKQDERSHSNETPRAIRNTRPSLDNEPRHVKKAAREEDSKNDNAYYDQAQKEAHKTNQDANTRHNTTNSLNSTHEQNNHRNKSR